MDIIITNSITGEQARTTSRAWWTDGALAVSPGRVEVARIHAESLTRRRASLTDIDAGRAVSQYQSGAEMTGEACQLMIGLTDSELAQYRIVPGKLVWPEIIDAPRPRNNRTDRPATMAQYQRAMDKLQNEV